MLGQYHSAPQINLNFRIEILYSHESEVKTDEDFLVTALQHRQLSRHTSSISNHIFSDLPEHWKYLADTVRLEQLCRGHFDIVIVEKFKNIAIGFCHSTKKRPVVLYRQCYADFKSLKLGDCIKGVLGKMYIHVENPTLILTDLYVYHVSGEANLRSHVYESYVSSDVLKIRDFTSEISKIQKINDYDVLFSSFGAIILPNKLSKILSTKSLKNTFIMGSIKYGLVGIAENRYACWTLHLDFAVYKKQILYAECVRGRIRIVPGADKKLRLLLDSGPKVVRMVEPGFVENVDNPVRRFDDINFVNFNDYLKINH
uniref:Uncharacterized protein n=1 Tax=Panagrolaimus sp. ES5 TaxID=591445 RepID=A0AC34GSU7_9BILA